MNVHDRKTSARRRTIHLKACCDRFMLLFQHPHAQYAQYALSLTQNRPFFAGKSTWILFGIKRSGVQIPVPRRKRAILRCERGGCDRFVTERITSRLKSWRVPTVFSRPDCTPAVRELQGLMQLVDKNLSIIPCFLR